MTSNTKNEQPDGGPSDVGAGYVSEFPAPGLPRTVRHITGHNTEGKSVFLKTDCGDHHRIMGEQQAVANILYSTVQTPVDVNGDVDIKQAEEHEVNASQCPLDRVAVFLTKTY